MMAYCSTCSAPLHVGAIQCPRCATPLRQQAAPAASAAVSLIRVSGRAKKAGMCVALGGLAIVLSAFIPWVSASADVILLHPTPTGGGQADIVIFGLLYAVFGARILMGSARRGSQVVLWVLGVVGGISVAAIFSALNDNTNFTGGTVQPAAGLFAAVVGVAAAVVGTLMFQTVRLPRKAVSAVSVPVAMLSPDGRHQWDGTSWRSIAGAAPPGTERSPDGHYWWDGIAWRLIPVTEATTPLVGS